MSWKQTISFLSDEENYFMIHKGLNLDKNHFCRPKVTFNKLEQDTN